MAKKGSSDNSTSNVTSRSFIKGMNKDFDSTYVPDGFWTHARNAQNNTIDGDLGEISNEPSNFHCASAPYTIIGAVHLFADKWVIYSTDDTNSEIGLYDQSECCYHRIVNDSCLGFNKKNLIYGVSKETAACTWQLYWADGLNPDRSMNIGNNKDWPKECITPLTLWDGPPWKQECTTVDGCKTCVDLPQLDCDLIRLARLVKTPCLKVQAGPGNGTLQKGSYFVVVAYTIEGQKVTDYFSPSNVQPLFDRENELGSSLEIIVEDMDTEHFDEFELVVVSFVDEQTVATKIGNYSTRVNVIELDAIDPTLPAVPIEQIPIRNNVYEKSDIMTTLNNYLLRLRPTTYFDFNYQPLANQIVATWACVEYNEDYYRKGGSKTSYMRDEVYAFYIRWIYDTGYKSPSYHIPGRAKIPGVDDIPIVNLDSVQYVNDGVSNEAWNVYNTATGANIPPVQVVDQQGIVGNIIARGNLGYWESTEQYPDDKPEVWNSSSQPWSGTTLPKYDLCGKNIRHHKMPDMFLLDTSKLNSSPWPYYNFDVAHFRTDAVTEQKYIRILGVEFGNIILPKDNDGNDIPNIVGYEILRATRKGNKTIIAKGLINNMGEYKSEMETNASTPSKRILYQNYPYNDVRPDPFLVKNSLVNQFENGDPFDVFKRDYLSFHSPDTQFDSHFLSTTQIKNHAVYSGLSTGQFIEPSQHPKFKQLGDILFLAAIATGVAIGITSTTGSVNRTYEAPFVYNPIGGVVPNVGTIAGFPISLSTNPAFAAELTAFNALMAAPTGTQLGSLISFLGGASTVDTSYAAVYGAANSAAALSAGFSVPYPSFTVTGGLQNNLSSSFINAFNVVGQVLGIIGESTDTLLRTFYTLIPAQQYALQYISQGYYSRPLKVNVGNINREILDASYIRPGMVDFRGERLVNNINRNRFALIKTAGAGALSFEFPNNAIQFPLLQDKSRVTIGTVGSQISNDPFTSFPIIQNKLPTYSSPGNEFRANILSYYSSIKLRKRNQYGQLDAPRQIPIGHCESKIDFENLAERTFTAGGKVYIHKVIPTAGEFFNGDIYICRYTEKTTMFYFYEWLYGQPENFEYDYGLRRMVPYPKYWVNNKTLSTSSAIAGMFSDLANLIFPGSPNTSGVVPSQFRKFDQDLAITVASALFFPIQAYFYLFNSGVRDFFVESEILVDFREQGQDVRQRFYDPNGYSDLTEIFKADPNIITTDNYYSYDKSLSVSRLFNNYISWGNLQSIYYNPYDSEKCYSYYPQRVIYSLPDTPEAARDNWYIFLTNNYKEYRNKLTYAKDINKNGGLFFFEDASPIQVVGVDQLQTDLGTKVTIGDGGLFSQPLQRIVNADSPYEYASCQDPLSVISTPGGLFWVSANQGKIYQYSGGLDEISNQGLKWWLFRYAKYALLEDFPDFPLTNNPVAGVGVMTVYDNVDGILYITHKDYKLKPQYKGVTIYDPSTNSFTINRTIVVKLNEGDDYKNFFDDASWTVSYDVKSKMWISFHDWHPDYVIPNKERFVTTKQNTMWYHNFNCQSYCNFYGVDYPFEIEVPVPTGNQIFSLRSIEYTMEAYKHSIQCSDSFHDLDFNFDEAVIWNTEQVSGLLKLNLQAKNNPIANLAYPIVNPGSIDILYSKEEQKYRFNQFWDITDDRGEFFNPGIPGFAERTIWQTEANGYIKNLNPNNLNYNKLQTQRKKFRHYINFLLLRRKVSGNRNIQLRIVNEKQQYSSR